MIDPPNKCYCESDSPMPLETATENKKTIIHKSKLLATNCVACRISVIIIFFGLNFSGQVLASLA